MPIEHEHKFVLKDFQGLMNRLENRYPKFVLDQFYVSDHARYRRIHSFTGIEHVFTYKRKTVNGVLEHEMAISAEDYRLAETDKVGGLHKIRFKAPGDESGVHWDIDFMLTDSLDRGGEVYFAMAECEHTAGQHYAVLPVLADHVLIAVPELDAHLFSNRKLVDQSYTREVVTRYRSPGHA
jgi:hypothetical protein